MVDDGSVCRRWGLDPATENRPKPMFDHRAVVVDNCIVVLGSSDVLHVYDIGTGFIIIQFVLRGSCK